MRHECASTACGHGARAARAGLLRSGQTKGQPQRICPSDQLVATSTSICTASCGTVSVRAHMPICRSAKLAAARRRLERAAQYTPTVSCPCPVQVVVARSRELAIRERRQPIKVPSRPQPPRGDLVAAAGDAWVPTLVTVPQEPLPRAREAAQRQPAPRASSDHVLRRDRRLHVRQRRHGRAQVQVPAPRRGAPDEYQT